MRASTLPMMAGHWMANSRGWGGDSRLGGSTTLQSGSSSSHPRPHLLGPVASHRHLCPATPLSTFTKAKLHTLYTDVGHQGYTSLPILPARMFANLYSPLQLAGKKMGKLVWVWKWSTEAPRRSRVFGSTRFSWSVNPWSMELWSNWEDRVSFYHLDWINKKSIGNSYRRPFLPTPQTSSVSWHVSASSCLRKTRRNTLNQQCLSWLVQTETMYMPVFIPVWFGVSQIPDPQISESVKSETVNDKGRL